MLAETLEAAWHARLRQFPIDTEPTFGSDSLTLGAGTVLARCGRSDNAEARLEGGEARVLVALSAAYCRPLGAASLAVIQRAMTHWQAGDPALAAMHLALGGFGRLPQPREAARRLFISDRLLDLGARPEDILAALDLDQAPFRRFRKYSPDQPRVPLGSGRTSGQWTSSEGDVSSVPASAPEQAPHAPAPGSPPASTTTPSAADAGQDAFGNVPDPTLQAIRDMVERALADLGPAARPLLLGLSPELLGTVLAVVSRLAAPVAFLTTLLIPLNEPKGVESAIPGHPNYHYERLPGETMWRITFASDQGVGEIVPGPDGVYRDARGNPLARLLPNGVLALNTQPSPSTDERHEEAEVCPQPTPDNHGQGPDSRGRAYEDQMKHLLNPERPTPSGFGRELPSGIPTKPRPVIFDDCWLEDGTMFEYKGPGYASQIAQSNGSVTPWFEGDKGWLDQSERQVESANGRRIVWLFAEPAAAEHAYEIFQTEDKGREKIVVGVFPLLEQ